MIFAGGDILRLSQLYQYCRYAKKTQISLDLKKYRYVGVITGLSDAKMVVKFYDIYSGRPAWRRALIYLSSFS